MGADIEYLKEKPRNKNAEDLQYKDIFQEKSSNGTPTLRLEQLLPDKQKKLEEYRSFLEAEIAKYEKKIHNIEERNGAIRELIEENYKKI